MVQVKTVKATLLEFLYGRFGRQCLEFIHRRFSFYRKISLKTYRCLQFHVVKILSKFKVEHTDHSSSSLTVSHPS